MGDVAVRLTLLVSVLVWGLAAISGLVSPLPAVAVFVLTVLPVLAIALALWTFVLWTVVPDHPLAGPAFALSLLGPLLQWGPAWPARPTANTSGEELRVMTWNVRRLWGGPDDAGDATACILTEIRRAEPDVLLLQEVSSAELARLAEPLGLDCTHGAYRSTDAARSAGHAVCTLGDRWTRDGGEVQPFGPDTNWRYVRTVVTRGDARLHVLGVHLHPYRLLHDPAGALADHADRLPATAAAQQSQARTLLAALGDTPARTGIGGDFNSARDTPVHARLRGQLLDVWERGAVGPAASVRLLNLIPVRIDYVYVTPDLGIVSAELPEVGCSDHRPIVTDLRVTP